MSCLEHHNHHRKEKIVIFAFIYLFFKKTPSVYIRLIRQHFHWCLFSLLWSSSVWLVTNMFIIWITEPLSNDYPCQNTILNSVLLQTVFLIAHNLNRIWRQWGFKWSKLECESVKVLSLWPSTLILALDMQFRLLEFGDFPVLVLY